ncbi:transmembrane protein 25 isoform X1 [Accipiter gentilis]|uniref:transmembrane protein 25 isoform X1 n=1 Tax=Astur gentilis TaxID=8957 RepID=UPI00210FC54D|nr:transmembrane protein 25 isoform X1 [Accipiter gentilis]
MLPCRGPNAGMAPCACSTYLSLSAERSQRTMGRPRGWPGAALAYLLLLLGLPVLCSAGLGELGPTIDGQPLAVCTLLEEESHAFTCRAPRPAPGATLTWYLDGRKQEANCSAAGTASTFTLTARRTDRELNCSLTDPASGETYNASVLLDVQCKVRSASPAPAGGVGRVHGGLLPSQSGTMTCIYHSCRGAASHQSCTNMAEEHSWLCCPHPRCPLPIPPAHLTACVCCPDKPEILRADARYQEVEGAGLLLVLFVLVQANPPASITWIDQDGQVMANASEFLLLGATRYQALANHSLRIHLSHTAGNFSISATNSVGITTTSLLTPGLLDARVELPLLGVTVGAALALGALLSLGSCAACLACRWPKTAPGEGRAEGISQLSRWSRCSSSEHPQPWGTRLPRQTRSLPPDLRLGDLAQQARDAPVDAETGARGEEGALPGPENFLVLSKLGFVQLPMSGRIYKVPSMSSDEIWL